MKVIIPELVVQRKRLGRNINHDPRSLRFTVPPAKVDRSVVWARHIPILDQGDLGSCTGNAETGLLGSDPFWQTLDAATQSTVNEALAVTLYSLSTQLDDYAGTYPPEDTGSDGLSVNKAAQQRDLISGYVWATSLEQVMALIQAGPFIIGSEWTTAMDDPNSEGIITKPTSGTVRGGHEYLCRQRDAEKGLWWFDNSWGMSFGKDGRFAYDDDGLVKLLALGGDVTQSVPITQAPPQPAPADPDLAAWWTGTKPWSEGHTFSAKTKAGKAASACNDFAKKKGLE